jgi:hypothetical protein
MAWSGPIHRGLPEAFEANDWSLALLPAVNDQVLAWRQNRWHVADRCDD